MRNCGVSKDVV